MRLSISTRHDDTARRGIARPNSVPLPRSHVSRFLDVADSYSGTACPRGSLHARGASPLCGALLSEPPRARQSLSCAFTSSPLSAVRRLWQVQPAPVWHRCIQTPHHTGLGVPCHALSTLAGWSTRSWHRAPQWSLNHHTGHWDHAA